MSAPLALVGGIALVVALTGAIVVAAPYLAVALILTAVIAYCLGEDEPEDQDKDKPP